MSEVETKKAAGFVLFEHTHAGRRFLLLRNRRHGTWGFPKGHCNDGEELMVCAHRELEEETSLTEVRVYPGCERTLSYFIRRGKSGYEKIVSYYIAEKLHGVCRLSEEHDEAIWVTSAEARLRLNYPDLRRLIDEADAFLGA